MVDAVRMATPVHDASNSNEHYAKKTLSFSWASTLVRECYKQDVRDAVILRVPEILLLYLHLLIFQDTVCFCN